MEKYLTTYLYTPGAVGLAVCVYTPLLAHLALSSILRPLCSLV